MKKTIVLFYFSLFGLSTLNMGYSQVIDSNQFENVVNSGSKTIYKNGVSKTYYIENGISITTTVNLLNQYGKYYQIHIEIENLSGSEFTFNPNTIIALISNYKTDNKTKIVSIGNQKKGVILPADEYDKKIRNRQGFQSALLSMAGQYNAEKAGYSSSVTSTAVYGSSNTYGSVNNYYTRESVNVSAHTSGSAVGTSVTQSYNGQAAYLAQKQEQKELQQFDNEQYQIRTELNQNYLRINSIEHLQRLKGSVNLVYEEADKVELLIPVNGKYYSFIYNNKQQSNKQENFQKIENKVVSNNPKVVELYSQSVSSFNNKRYTDGAALLTDALLIEPRNINLLSSRSILYFYYVDLKNEGLEDAKNAILFDALNKNKYNNYLSLCQMYKIQENFDLLLKSSEEMIKLEPNKTEGYFERAYANSNIKNHYAAITDYQKIITISNRQLKTYDNLGVVYNNMGYQYVLLEDYEKALPLIDKAIELLPNHSYIWGSRGQLYYEKKEYKKCITDMTTAIDLVEKGNNQGNSSDRSVPYYYRALSNIKRGKAKESCFDLTKAIELGNRDAETVFNENCKN